MISGPPRVHLRTVREGDLDIFFEQQRDSTANHMAAFTVRDPDDKDAFYARWRRLLSDPTIINRAVDTDGVVVGHVASFMEDGRRELTYWIGREYWGRGLATAAVEQFVAGEATLPLFARAAKDNLGSLRVLEKCGFRIIGEDRGFAAARNAVVEEFILVREDG